MVARLAMFLDRRNFFAMAAPALAMKRRWQEMVNSQS
jgi:hypothetical protein